MAFLTVADEELFFLLSEGRFPRNAVLVHGAGADHSHWPAELEHLPGHTVYYLDLPGHGRSKGLGRISVAAYADTVAGFVDTLALSQVVVFGHSMGGAIVQMLALKHPTWLKAIVLVGSGSRLRVPPALIEQLGIDFSAAVDTLCQALFGLETPPAMVAAERQRYLRTDWRLLRDDLLACDAFDVTQRLSEIALPTLIVTGDADVLTPVKYAQFLKDNIPGAQMVVIPGAGHMVAREKPAEFIRAVIPFLGSMG
jgi:pimeloyl-ACP methyl ester carboxylesterase